MNLEEIADRIDFIIKRANYVPSTAGKELVTLRNELLVLAHQQAEARKKPE